MPEDGSSPGTSSHRGDCDPPTDFGGCSNISRRFTRRGWMMRLLLSNPGDRKDKSRCDVVDCTNALHPDNRVTRCLLERQRKNTTMLRGPCDVCFSGYGYQRDNISGEDHARRSGTRKHNAHSCGRRRRAGTWRHGANILLLLLFLAQSIDRRGGSASSVGGGWHFIKSCLALLGARI